MRIVLGLLLGLMAANDALAQGISPDVEKKAQERWNKCVKEHAFDYAIRSDASIVDVAHAAIGACRSELNLYILYTGSTIQDALRRQGYDEPVARVTDELARREEVLKLYQASHIAMEARISDRAK